MSCGNCFRDPKYREWQIPCPPKDLDYADTPLPDFTVFMIKVGKIKDQKLATFPVFGKHGG
jgi:hypothetical protein